jgi:hypothetical protein
MDQWCTFQVNIITILLLMYDCIWRENTTSNLKNRCLLQYVEVFLVTTNIVTHEISFCILQLHM